MSGTLFTTTGVTDSDRMLHTPSPFAKSHLLYVQEVGRLKSLQPHKSQRENLDSYLVLTVLSGSGTVTIKGTEHQVKKGECIFINCLETYSHESSIKNPWELSWVHFNGSIAPAYFELFREQYNGQNIFKPLNFKQFTGIIESLLQHQKDKDLESELLSGELLIQLLNQCLISIMRSDKNKQEVNKQLCREIREYINESYKEANLVQSLTDKFTLEKQTIDSNFQKIYGISLEDYIMNRRFTAAKELLRFTIRPIEQIIAESGIDGEEVFRLLFQEGEGMTAEEYRMKWSQWVK